MQAQRAGVVGTRPVALAVAAPAGEARLPVAWRPGAAVLVASADRQVVVPVAWGVPRLLAAWVPVGARLAVRPLVASPQESSVPVGALVRLAGSAGPAARALVNPPWAGSCRSVPAQSLQSAGRACGGLGAGSQSWQAQGSLEFPGVEIRSDHGPT